MPPTLLSLPTELRELIYEELFRPYVVRHGFGRCPHEHRAAILQTCKRIHQEAWRFLPQCASFQFRGTEAMLETLLSVDQSVVTRIRNIRVKAFQFPLYATGQPDSRYYTTYNFSNALTLLPGLHLDKLIVEDSFHGFGLVDTWRDLATYLDFEELLKSDAWRELEYSTPNTDFITSGYDFRERRVAQPEGWDALIKERDGDNSEAVVQMFLKPESSNTNNEQDDANFQRPWSAQPGHKVAQNFRLAGPDQDLKGQVTIVARRGRRANYVQTGLSETKTWRELKNQEGGFSRPDWAPYYHDMADAAGWMYGGWGTRMQLAHRALNI